MPAWQKLQLKAVENDANESLAGFRLQNEESLLAKLAIISGMTSEMIPTIHLKPGAEAVVTAVANQQFLTLGIL